MEKEEKKNSINELQQKLNNLRHNPLTYIGMGMACEFIPTSEELELFKNCIIGTLLIKAALEDPRIKTQYQLKKEYQEIENRYHEVINNIINIGEELEWDSEAKIFAGYSYLLKNGYLSNNHQFYYSKTDNIQVGNLYGLNVIEGFGNCKHINSFLTDLLAEKGYISYNIAMQLTSISEKLNNDSIKKKKKKENQKN